MQCAVFECKNFTKSIDNRKLELNFYPFPKKDAGLCQKWVEFCRRPQSFSLKSARICGDHFRAKDKVRNMKYEMGFQKAYCPKLRPGALPCIYPETNQKVLDSNKKTNLGSFPTVIWEGDSELSEESLFNSKQIKGPNEDPLTTNIKMQKIRLPVVNLNSQQTAVVNQLKKATVKSQTPLKGVLAVVYPVDAAGKPIQCSLLQNVKLQAANANPAQIIPPPMGNLQQLRDLKSEIVKLKKNEQVYKKTIKSLENEVIKCNYQRQNLEEKLKTIFTNNQIRHLKTGKRVIWSAEDMALAIKLYKTSPAAYKLLKNKNFPFPSQQTVIHWNQVSRTELNESAPGEEEQNDTQECLDTSSVDYNKSVCENAQTDTQNISEFLTFHSLTDNEQDDLESKNRTSFSAAAGEDHSYFLVAD